MGSTFEILLIIDQEVAARLHSFVRASSPPPSSQNITFIGGVAVTTPSLYKLREAAVDASREHGADHAVIFTCAEFIRKLLSAVSCDPAQGRAL